MRDSDLNFGAALSTKKQVFPVTQVLKSFGYTGRGGFGSQTAADPPPPRRPSETSEKQTVAIVAASHEMLILQALSSTLSSGTAKRGCLGRGKAFKIMPVKYL